MEAKDEYWVESEEECTEYISHDTQVINNNDTNIMENSSSILWVAFAHNWFPFHIGASILEAHLLCEYEIESVLTSLKRNGLLEIQERQCKLTQDAIVSGARLSKLLFKKPFLESIFQSWCHQLSQSLEHMSKQFVKLNGDREALCQFDQDRIHFMAFFEYCLQSSDHQWHWYHHPLEIRYHDDTLSNFSIPYKDISLLADILCDGPFLSFVLTPAAQSCLLSKLHSITLTHYDMRRYAKIYIALSRCALECYISDAALNNQRPEMADISRRSKEYAEQAQRLLQPMLTATSLGSEENTELEHSLLQSDHCEALNALGFSLTCLGCEGPAVRKHEEAISITSSPLKLSRSEALRGVALLSTAAREPANLDEQLVEEAVRCLISVLETLEREVGPDHLVTVWVMGLLSAVLATRLGPTSANNFPPPIALALRSVASVRSKLEVKHPFIGTICGLAVKTAMKTGQYAEACEWGEVAIDALRWSSQHHQTRWIPHLNDDLRTLEREMDNCRRKARRSTRMGHDANRSNQ